eukprot:TRINITY_DN17770_c1_g1_i1.p1 TRINITY_DN17770_c1_g1~~TRINITY_DN17770_c1_g1_i1.p1  ORF type:complete len:353 (-),score=47.33 TRINITY_DN17770_c1_g1_i1:293-1351(-)
MPDVDAFQIREISTMKGAKIQVGTNILERLPKFNQDEIFCVNMDQLPHDESYALQKLSEICGFRLSTQKIPQAIELTHKNSSPGQDASDLLNIEVFFTDLLLGKKPQRNVNRKLNEVQNLQNQFQNVMGIENVNQDENTSDDNEEQPSALDLFLSHSKALIQSANNSQKSQQQKTQDSAMKSTVNLQQEEGNQMDVDTDKNQSTSNTNKINDINNTNNNYNNSNNNSINDGDGDKRVVFTHFIVATNFQQDLIAQPQNQAGVKNYKKFVKTWPTYMQRNVTVKEAGSSKSTGQQHQQGQRSFQYTTYEMDVDDREFRQQEAESAQRKRIAEEMFNTPVNMTNQRKTPTKRKR